MSNRNRAETRSFKQIQRDHQSLMGEGRLYEGNDDNFCYTNDDNIKPNKHVS